MNRIINVLVITAMTLMSSCYFHVPCIEGAGEIVQESRSADGFSSVNNETSFDVYIVQDDTFSVMVKARESLVRFIETERTGGTLYIYTRTLSCLRNAEDVEIYISMPEIDELQLSGSGLIYCEQIEGEVIEISSNGSGRIQIDSLFCTDIYLKNSGSGEIFTSLVDAAFLSAKLSSSGEIDYGEAYIGRADIKVSGSGLLMGDIFGAELTDVALSSSGKVRLFGDSRDLNTHHSGSGRIDALDLLALDVTSRSSGSGNTYINVSGVLDVSIVGSGSISYLGEPIDITSRITGSGRLSVYN